MLIEVRLGGCGSFWPAKELPGPMATRVALPSASRRSLRGFGWGFAIWWSRCGRTSVGSETSMGLSGVGSGAAVAAAVAVAVYGGEVGRDEE